MTTASTHSPLRSYPAYGLPGWAEMYGAASVHDVAYLYSALFDLRRDVCTSRLAEAQGSLFELEQIGARRRFEQAASLTQSTSVIDRLTRLWSLGELQSASDSQYYEVRHSEHLYDATVSHRAQMQRRLAKPRDYVDTDLVFDYDGADW